jgi:uncharacterized protein
MRGRQRFDAFKLAAGEGELRGEIEPRALERLADRVAEGPGRVDWSIRGSADAQGRAALVIAIDGAVPLECQRCLKPLQQPVRQTTTLLLARDNAGLVQLDDASEHEVILADAPLDPVALVEDELLLSLPFAPRHEDECASERAATAD